MLRKTGLAFCFSLSLLCAGSLANDEVATATEPAAKNPAAEPAKEATAPLAGRVSGKITFEGEAPAPEAVDMAADPVCQGMHADGFTRTLVRTGEGGGLADAFVQLTGVPDEKYEAPEEPVELDQRGCTYYPHVFGVMKKQDIKIINSDDTLHNIHAVPKTNKEFNVGMPNKGMTIEKSFKKAEEAIKIKCDVHPWMGAFAFSMDHPYFAVTDDNGAFAIDTAALPDGDYGVKVWHEVLGEKEGKLTVKDGAATFDLALK